jgi:hypothetical protein
LLRTIFLLDSGWSDVASVNYAGSVDQLESTGIDQGQTVLLSYLKHGAGFREIGVRCSVYDGVELGQFWVVGLFAGCQCVQPRFEGSGCCPMAILASVSAFVSSGVLLGILAASFTLAIAAL